MCLQEEAEVRPLIIDVVTALSFLSTVPDENLRPLPYPPEPEPKPEPEEESRRDDFSSDSDSDSESRKIRKDRDGGASANFTSARNHETDTSDDEEEKHEQEEINPSNHKSIMKNGNKESEHKRVAFKDDVQPPPKHTRKDSSSSSDEDSPRSSNASENGRIDSLQSSRDSEAGGGDSSFKLENEPSENVNSTDSTLEHISSRESHTVDEGFEAQEYSSDSDGGSAHGGED